MIATGTDRPPTPATALELVDVERTLPRTFRLKGVLRGGPWRPVGPLKCFAIPGGGH